MCKCIKMHQHLQWCMLQNHSEHVRPKPTCLSLIQHCLCLSKVGAWNVFMTAMCCPCSCRVCWTGTYWPDRVTHWALPGDFGTWVTPRARFSGGLHWLWRMIGCRDGCPDDGRWASLYTESTSSSFHAVLFYVSTRGKYVYYWAKTDSLTPGISCQSQNKLLSAYDN